MQPRELSKMLSVSITLFTRDIGPIPTKSWSAHCRRKSSQIYAGEIILTQLQSAVRVTTTTTMCTDNSVACTIPVSCRLYRLQLMFTWRRLCVSDSPTTWYAHGEFIASFGSLFFDHNWIYHRVSATNNAAIYNLEHEGRARILTEWPAPSQLTAELVWDGFFLNALLRECQESHRILELTEGGSDRLNPALERRNIAMVGPGQDLWNHACNLCCSIEKRGGELSEYFTIAL